MKRRRELRRRWRHSDRGSHFSTALQRLHWCVQHDACMCIASWQGWSLQLHCNTYQQTGCRAGYCTASSRPCSADMLMLLPQISTGLRHEISLQLVHDTTCRMRAATHRFWGPWPRAALLSHPSCSGQPTHPPAAPISVRCAAATLKPLCMALHILAVLHMPKQHQLPQRFAYVRRADTAANHHQ